MNEINDDLIGNWNEINSVKEKNEDGKIKEMKEWEI